MQDREQTKLHTKGSLSKQEKREWDTGTRARRSSQSVQPSRFRRDYPDFA